MPNALELHCVKCRIAETCPKKGSSPLYLEGGRKMVLCRIVGGYGHDPVNPDVLSESSKALAAANGGCLSIAEIPTRDLDSGHIYFETTKIFHQPIRHPREHTELRVDIMMPKTHNG